MNEELRLPRNRFGYAFLVLARRWRRLLEERLEEAGFTDATWRPLIHLQEIGDGVTQKALAAAVGLDTSSLVRLLDILVRKGLVERRIDPEDRRARRVYLTEAGRAVVSDVRRILCETEEPLLAALSDAEIAATMTLLERMTDTLATLTTPEDQNSA